MRFNQRDIVELNFELPNGKFKVHPALVVSNQNVFEAEDIFYAVMISSKEFDDEFTFALENSMLTKPLIKKSFVKLQLIQAYSEREILRKISSVKQPFFDEILKLFFAKVF